MSNVSSYPGFAVNWRRVCFCLEVSSFGGCVRGRRGSRSRVCGALGSKR